MNGIILINKPLDFTSHDVVAKARGILKTRKIGHAGTLDPMATGVLPLFIGPATKAVDRLPDQDKSYIATLQLGVTTDTQDITGKVLGTTRVVVGRAEVEPALLSFKGKQHQLPPMYSAVQVGGRRLYDLARAGLVVEREPREIEIYDIKLLDCEEQKGSYTFSVDCSKGSYIRTICHDIGEKLGCGGVLAALMRTKSSGFRLEDCVTLEQLLETADKTQLLLPVESVFTSYEKLVLSAELTRHYLNGVPLWLSQLAVEPKGQWLRLYDEGDMFLGIAVANKESGKLSDQKQFLGDVNR